MLLDNHSKVPLYSYYIHINSYYNYYFLIYVHKFHYRKIYIFNYCNIPEATPNIPTANNPNMINNGLTFFFNKYIHANVNRSGTNPGIKLSNTL